MRKTIRITIVLCAISLIVGGVGVARAATGDADTPITGTDLALASTAALTSTGQGRVTDTEVGDEDRVGS